MQASVTYNGVCVGGNHVSLTITLEGKTRTVSVLKSDLMQDSGWEALTEDQAVIREIRRHMKRQGITTWAAARSEFNSLLLDI